MNGHVNNLKTERQPILDAVVEGICGVDAEGRATFCNDAVLEMTGYQEEEVVGQDLHALLHHTRPDGTRYPPEECAFREAIGANQPAHILGEFLWRKDGTCFPAEYWVRALAKPWSQTRCVATLKDITDIERAKEALHESEEKYRRILASAPDVAWTSNQRGRTIYISPKAEAMLGYTTAEIYAGGTHLWLNQIHAEDFGRVNRAYLDLFEKQVAYDEEYRLRRKDGTWIWVHDRSSGTHHEKGDLYADGFHSDITRRN